MLDDTDLSALTPEEAKEYVVAFITTLRQTRREMAKLAEDLKLWEARVKLAEEKREYELKSAAERKVQDILERISFLEMEERELAPKVSVLRERLRSIQHKPKLSIDAEALLEELKIVAGEEDKTEKAIRDLEVESELDQLKKKIGDQ